MKIPKKASEPDLNSLGIGLRNLTDAEKAQLRLDVGVLVQRLADDASGCRCGLRP
ncbi:MAG: hypothetical protein IPI79_00130 [Moraxellaceae bacterium]|nr:hypothetical protein [Moraxellaceae bacterium]